MSLQSTEDRNDLRIKSNTADLNRELVGKLIAQGWRESQSKPRRDGPDVTVYAHDPRGIVGPRNPSGLRCEAQKPCVWTAPISNLSQRTKHVEHDRLDHMVGG